MDIGSDPTLATQLYRRLRQDLLEGRIAPGERLKVQAVALRCGAGASPVREALSSLTAEGLVERLDQRGFRAVGVSAAGFDDLLNARCWTEEAALRESIAAGGQAWEEALVVARYRLQRTPRRHILDPAWKAVHVAFHRALLAACPSPTLLLFTDALRDRVARYRHLAGTAPSYPEREIGAEHEAIAEAALARQPAEACPLLVAHLRRTGEYVRTAMLQERVAP